MRISIQNRAVRILGVSSLAVVLAFGPGCAKRPPQGPDAAAAGAQAPAAVDPDAIAGQEEERDPGAAEPIRSGRQIGPRISTYYLSAGDEIRVSVFGYGELERTVRIPPNGQIFFPLVGDIDVDGMSIPELRKIIADRLRTADEQRIGSGDQVVIRVYRHEELTVATTVPNSGQVTLPLAGAVDLVGLTVEAANAAIAEKLTRYVVGPSVSTTIQLSASGLPGRITDPHVSIEVMAFGGHKVVVLGEVRRPGVYVSSGGSRLLELVAQAGGPTDDAKLGNVALVRPATETSQPLAVVVNLDRAMKAGDVTQNPPVQRGDVIYVPKRTFASLAQFFDYVFRIVRPFAIFSNLGGSSDRIVFSDFSETN